MKTSMTICAAVSAALSAVTLDASMAADLGGGPRRPSQPVDAAPSYQVPFTAGSWAGPYAGVSYGYATGSTDVSGGLGTFNIGQTGGLGTAFAGYNWQYGSTVLGLEGDIGGGTLSGANGGVGSEINVIGTLRGRAGILVTPSFLVYGTAGLAIADYDLRAGGVTKSETFTGYQVGAGTELQFQPRATLRLEYTYTGFGDEKVAYGAFTNTYEPDFHTIRAGVALKF